MAYDTVRQRVLLFGGITLQGNRLGDLWAWDGTSWTELCTTAPCNMNLPPGRSNAAVAYDRARHKLIVFGGSDGSFLADTWEWDGTWALAATTGPAARECSAIAFDSGRNVTVLFSGRSAAGLTTGTWEWSGMAWVNVDSGGPTPRECAAMAYDSVRGVSVLFGGQGNANISAQLWEWNGTAWAQQCRRQYRPRLPKWPQHGVRLGSATHRALRRPGWTERQPAR
jgi:hypothetical protein